MRKIYSTLLATSLVVFLSFSVLTGCQQKNSTKIEAENEEEKKDGYDGPEARMMFEIMRTKDLATGKVPWEKLLLAKQQTEFARQAARTEATMALSWIERGPNSDVVGPSNGNSRANGGITSGRIRATMVDSLDPTRKTVWVGGVDGGLWKTTDITTAPATWTLINDFLSNLAIAAICQDPRPGFQNNMYFCTGESFGNADAVQGVGVFKSTDGGNTWNFLPSTASYINGTRILCDYQGNVYLGSRQGLFRSTDGGTSWTDITPTGTGIRVCDLEISSTATAARLHVVTGIFSTMNYRYTDIPATATTASGWNSATTPFTGFTNRAELGISGNTLYACPSNNSYQVPTVWKSSDGGANWAATTAQPAANWANGQAWYDISVGINPADPDNVIVGGLDCHETSNGGLSWTKISAWVGTTGQYVHADQHDIQWWQGGTRLMFACDGGIHFSTDGGTTIRDRNQGLRLKQFYSVAMHPTITNHFLAGAQDNGTHLLTNPGLGASVEVTGGDGAYTDIDQDEPQYQFGAYVYNQYRRSTNTGATWGSVNFSSSAGMFINPFDYDDAANIIYASHSAGQYLRWNNPQTGSSSSLIPITEFNGAQVSAIHASPHTANRVYFGTTGGRVVQVDNAESATPTATLINSGLSAGYINCIVTGSSDQFLLACYTNYNLANNIFVSTNGGVTWTGIEGNLPNMPVRWALFHPDDNTKAYIATETGVWETDLINGSSTIWSANPTFPNVRTDMIKYRSSDRTIAAGTHGRGVWSAQIPGAGGFSFNNPAPTVVTCPAPTTMDVVLTTIAAGGFSNPITVSSSAAPAGTTVSFIPSNIVTPGNNVIVRLSGTNTLSAGSYVLTITGTANSAATQTRDITYTINPGSGPAITAQPSNQTICAGSNTSFSITSATATTFQWQLSTDGGATYNNVPAAAPYSGVTSATLNITGATGALNSNRYRCNASTQCGTTASSAAILTVNTAPAITSQPTSASVCTGANQTFTVGTTGTSLTHQWYISTDGGGTFNLLPNGGVYSGATTASLTITGVTAPLNNNQYRCVVTGVCPVSPLTSNAATLTVATSLSISGQPVDVVTCVGNNTSFTVTAVGAGTYQWQVSTDGGATYNNVTNGGVYSGATLATLNITGATAVLSGNRYRCNLTSTCGNATSNAALLTVNSLPAITSQPADNTLCSGSSNTFSVTATGTGIGYQWQISTNGCAGPWTNIGGATSSSYTLTGITAGQNNTGYRCVVTGVCAPAVTSNCALLTVVTSVAITTQPVSQTVCEGSGVSFTVAGSGTGIIYQWQLSTDGGTTYNNIGSANSATYTIPATTFAMNNNRYRCQLSNATCTTPGVTNAAILTVNTLPAISAQPQNASVCVGGSNTFSVTATGTGIGYQWQLSTDGGTTYNNIGGATSSSYTVSAATIGMNGNRYSCVVTGTCAPAATSSAAILTVISPVVITTQPANVETCSGGNATFTVAGSSTQTVIYQWQISTDNGATWTNVTGANAATHIVANTSVIMNGNRYRCLLSSATCSAPTTSNAVILTVRQLPSIGLTAAPLTSLLPGQTTTLTATPSPSTGGTLTTTWYRDATAFTNTGNTYVADVTKLGSYQVKIQESWLSGLTCFSESPIVIISATVSSKLFIFPSPNDGQFTVSYYNNGGAGTTRTVTVYDSKGARVHNAKFPVVGPYTLLSIDLRPAQRGIYYVVVGDATGKKLAEGKVMVNW